MFLLAESGSTKTDWLAFDESGIRRTFRTTGINPDIQPEEVIAAQLAQDFQAVEYSENPHRIFFYGAGLKGQHNRNAVKRLLKGCFPDSETEVEHDLLAAARASCLEEEGIACILGTGSNSCYYDGKSVIENHGGHGYLLGDEGSGADLGKALMRKVLSRDLPEDLIRMFEDWIGLPVLEIRREVHQSARPNVYLARLSRFVHDHLDRPEIRGLVQVRFKAFFEETVMRYDKYLELPANCVGSVAWHYRELLTHTAAIMGIRVGRIIQNPAEGLVEFHRGALIH